MGTEGEDSKEMVVVQLPTLPLAATRRLPLQGDCGDSGSVTRVGANDPAQGQPGEWVNYAYTTAHPILRWLPSKLAEWIGDDYGAALGIPPRNDAAGWTVGELNAILENNIVPGTRVTSAPLEPFSGRASFSM